MTASLGARIQIVGDDNLVTNPRIIAGTVSETMDAVPLCRSDRMAKYNRLLEIEHELGRAARFGR